MQMLFLSSADAPLFIREDYESAHWTQEEMSLTAVFPYNPDKIIQRGMRVAFQDPDGTGWQVFEIRNIGTIEPDHYQQLTAEHIAISELSDCHIDAKEFTDRTPAQALATVLTGTGWTRSANEVTATSSGDTARGSVWQAVQAIAQNWNCLILPRVTIDATGITHRYLDIRDPEGVFRGIRLGINKNMPDVTVTYDDTECYTALYGYGGTVGEDDDRAELTFADVVWEATSQHPAKPDGQTYLEDPARTALYGRDGVPRFGYYQNGDITDADLLLEKTWETLNTKCDPKISIQGTVADLYRLGYRDQPLRLNDIAVVEVQPIGVTFYKKIIRLDVDLADPTSTTVEIGDYIPNIIYINRDTAERASGGGGGGGHGQTNEEKQILEFETDYDWTTRQIRLKAWQRDLEHTDDRLLKAYAAIGLSSSQIDTIVTASGVMLDENNNIIVDANGNPVFYNDANPMFSRIIQNAEGITSLVTKTGVNSLGQNETLYSQIQQNASAITLKVSRGDVSTQLAVECDNVHISGGDLIVDGYITSAGLVTEMASFTGNIACLGNIVSTGTLSGINLTCESVFSLQGESISVKELSFLGSTYNYAGQSNVDLAHYHAISASESNGVITITQGAAQTTPGTASFNIAATQFYQDAIVAAQAQGAASVTLSAGGWTGPSGTNTVTASNGQSVTVSLPSFTTSGGTSWTSAHQTTVYFSTASVSAALASKTVDASSVYSEGYTQGYQDAGGGSGTYSAGWQAARAMVDPPATIGSGEVLSFDVDVPGATEDTQQTYTFTLQKGTTPAASGYASVALNGNPVGRIEIGSWYTAGVNSVSVTKVWEDNVCTCNPSAGTGLGKTITINATVGTPTTSSPNIYPITIKDGSGSSAVTVLSTTVDATARYNAGWADARAKVAAPAANTSSPDFSFDVPSPTVGNTQTLNYSLIKSDTPGRTGYVTAQRDTGRNVARVSIGDWYDAGWAAARNEVQAAPAGTGTTFSIHVPHPTIDGGYQSLNYELVPTTTTPGSTGLLQVKRTTRVVAQYDIGAWYTAGVDSVTIDSTTWGGTTTNVNNTITMTASNGATRSQALFITGGTGFNSSHTTTVYLRNTSTSGTIRARKTIDATDVYNAGAAAESAKYTSVSNAKSGLSYKGRGTLGSMDGNTFVPAGTGNWYLYTGSSGSFETLYSKTT